MNLTVKNYDRKCRTCGTDIKDYTCGIPIFGNGLFLDGKIYRYLYIDVRTDDSLPKTICATCFIKIESIDKFAYLATKTQEAFRNWLLKSDSSPEPAITQNVPTNPTTIITTTNNNNNNSEPTAPTANATTNNNNEEAIKKIIMKTFRNPRNPRHVEHVTLEQIINDQIVRNAKIPLKPKVFEPPEIVPIIEFKDLKLGQLIKDPELLDLILKSLKWMTDTDDVEQYDAVLTKLKNSNLKEVLSNTNLLKDEDIMKLIRSYVGHDGLNVTPPPPPQYSITKIESPALSDGATKLYASEEVSQMEVSVDPNLFFDDEDEGASTERKKESVEIVPISAIRHETPAIVPNKDIVEIIPLPKKPKVVQADEAKFQNTGKLICSSCPCVYSSATDLQHHVLTQHLIKKSGEPSSEPPATEKIAAKQETKKRGRRRERKKSNGFTCPICHIKLSTKGNLKVHIERGAHKPKEKFQCEVEACKKLFRTVANLQRHKRSHHNEEKTEPSPSTAQDKPHTCNLCDQTFTQNKDLKFHLKNEHNEENPNKCHCGKIFTNQRLILAHQKRMHNNEPKN